MLHRALRYALVPFAPTPGLLHPRSLYPNQSSQIEEEASMEVALKASSGPETLSSTQQHEEAAWAVERSALLGDEFSVDDLLDFGGLTDIEQEEGGGGGEEEVEEKEAQPEPMEADNPNSSCSSALSFEQTPPSEIALPTDYVAELEWVSHFVDESFADFPLPCSAASLSNPTAKKPQAEVSSFAKRTAACMLSTDAPVPVQAKRSKRSRARRWLRSVPTPFPEPASSTSSSSSSSSSISPSCVLLWASRSPVREKPKKKRGRKPRAATQRPAASALGVGGVGDRRCSHCGAQKTPQWRAGPEGPKTLCNACGVRFKSGRLLPEYRPACSPTFLSHAHSNSHRKVLEMRRKKAELGLLPPSPPPVSSP